MEAFDLALKHGCDGFEFDVRYTSDAHTVLCHDPYLNGLEVVRTSYDDLCRSVPPRPLAELRSSHAVSSAVSSAAMLSPEPRLPSLEDVIRSFADTAFLDIELKIAGDIQRWLPLLRRTTMRRGYVISSFFPDVLLAVHESDRDLPLALIVGTREGEELGNWRELPISTLILNSRMVVSELVDEAHAAGKQLFVWTVNQKEEMLELAAMGVDGIISDDTQLLCSTLKQD